MEARDEAFDDELGAVVETRDLADDFGFEVFFRGACQGVFLRRESDEMGWDER
jgi:hypothetical protein